MHGEPVYTVEETMFIKRLIIIVYLAGVLTSCTTGVESGTNGSFTAAVWNVQSLFDGTETGNEYAEFRAGSGWTQEKYEARLLSAAQAIVQMNTIPAETNSGKSDSTQSGIPDFIGLVELENEGVMNDLLHGHLSKHGFYHAFFGNAANMSLGIGVLSRYPLIATKVHSITVKNETIPRPILEVHLEPMNKPLVFFICHWKSKVGGEDATESLRQAAARIIERRVNELRQEKPGTPVIIMGDLNENHDEFFRRDRILSALLPDVPEAALKTKKHTAYDSFIILSSEKPPVTKHFDPAYPVFYTPWGNELTDGTYYFRDNWETIDHILLSAELFDEEGWLYDTCKVLNFPPFTNSKGLPNAYNPRTGIGLSDHLPLMLLLK